MSESYLELAVGSNGVAKGAERLDRLTQSATAAERAAQKLAQTSERSAQQQTAAEQRAARGTEEAERRRTEATSRAARERLAAQEAAAARAVQTERLAQEQQLLGVKKQLMTEQQLIRQGELERRRIILTNTAITEQQRAQLLRLSLAKTNKEMKAATAKQGVTGATKKYLLPLVGIGAGLMVGRSVLNVTLEFDKLHAALVTATGSAREAEKAFDALQEFGMTTPYSLRQAVDAFVQLRQLGLDPSERALRAYGNMAAAMGDQLDHMILAASDAVMGIPRPLRQFGVHMSVHGDKVKMAFRGMTTEIGNNTQEIEEYLIRLSENNFSEAMANRMKTLDGALSNLGDAWDKLVVAFTQSGIESAVSKMVTSVGDNLGKLSEYIKENQEGFELLAKVAKYATIPVTAPVTAGKAIWDYFTEGDQQEVAAKREQDRLAKYRQDLAKIEAARSAEELKELIEHLKTKDELLEESYAKQRGIIRKGGEGNAELQAEQYRRLEEWYRKEKEKNEKEDKPKKSQDRKAFERLEGELLDDLGKMDKAYAERSRIIDKFTRYGTEKFERMTRASVSAYAEELAALEDKQNKEIKTIRDSLKTEEEALEESYRRRRKIIEESTTGEPQARLLAREDARYRRESNELLRQRYTTKRGSGKPTPGERIQDEYESSQLDILLSDADLDKKQDQLGRLRREYEAEMRELQRSQREAWTREREALRDGLRSEEEERQLSYDRRQRDLERALEQELITGDEYAELRAQHRERQAADEAAYNQGRIRLSLDATEQIFANMAEAARVGGGAQSESYKRLFALQQSFATASATVAMFQSISEGLKKGFPAGIPEMLMGAAQGTALLSRIASVQYAGAYDAGGHIPAGRFGIVGERRPEIVEGPANVIGGEATKQLLGRRNGGVTVVVAPDANTAAMYARSTHNEAAFLAFAQKNRTTLRRLLAS
jgi:hypothetical protein